MTRLIIVYCLMGFVFLIKGCGIIINVSSSMAKGFYIRKFSLPHRGDTVAVCLDKNLQKLGLKNHYLKYGSCHGGSMIIKKILAVPGDVVQLTDIGIIVNNQFYLFPTFNFDHAGHRLTIYPRGTYHNTNGFWLIGTQDPHSWDSRYWGPVTRQQIKETLRLLI